MKPPSVWPCECVVVMRVSSSSCYHFVTVARATAQFKCARSHPSTPLHTHTKYTSLLLCLLVGKTRKTHMRCVSKCCGQVLKAAEHCYSSKGYGANCGVCIAPLLTGHKRLATVASCTLTHTHKIVARFASWGEHGWISE